MKIIIERFKNIERIELETSDTSRIAMLVGGNNAGKSSILQAIQFGVSVAQTSKIQHGTWYRDRLSTSIGQNDLVYSPIKDVLALARNGSLREEASNAICISYHDGVNESCVSVRKGRNKNILLEIVGKDLGERLQSIQEPICTLVTGLAGIPSEEEFETNFVVRKAAARGDSNSVLRNILFQLKQQPDKWARFTQQIKQVFPEYLISISFDHEMDETILCKVSKSGRTYPIDTCGTGLLQTIQIFAYVNLFSPKLLLLDEPDSHLHPNNQKQLGKELISVSEDGVNIIIATHSKHLVEALNDHSDLIWVSGGARKPEVEGYDVKALLDIGALNVGERVRAPQYVFLTEDSKHDLLKVLLESNDYDLGECEIVSYSGCTQVTTAQILIKYLKSKYPESKFAIHRDRDFLSDADLARYSDLFHDLDVRFFIPEGNDIESHFLKAAHIAGSCAIEESVAREILSEAFNARKDKIIEKYINTIVENKFRAKEKPNVGEIGVEASKAIMGPESRAVHGKTLLAGVRDELRNRGITDKIVLPATTLRYDPLGMLYH